MKFKKISAVLGTMLMTGLTLGTAAAATYPAPFVESGTGDVAIVYGTGTGANDMTAAGSIQDDLSEALGGITSVDGGELFELYKDNDQLHFGDSMNTVMDSSLDDNDLDSLADGDYDSGSIDTEYSQTVDLFANSLSLIADSDLNNEEPTIGYSLDDADVLTYTLSFDDTVAYSDMAETDFPLFGKTYYVLDATTTKITLLNSAEKNVIAEGESLTIGGKTVSIEYITDSNVKFNVDGESTDKLADGEYFELEDESYIVLSEGLYTEKDGSVSKAEFSLGSGKVVLEDTQEIEVNDDAVDGLTSALTTNGTAGFFDSVAITWATDGEVFLTEGDTIDMPVFSAYSFVLGDVDFGDTIEDIVVENGDTLTLQMANYEVEMLHNDTSTTYAGGDEAELVTMTATESYDQLFAIAEDERILGTVLDTDVGDVETAYFEIASLNNDTTKFDLSLNDLIGTSDVDFVDASANDDEDLTDEINLKVIAVYDSGDSISVAHSLAYNNTVYALNNVSLQDFAVVNVSSTETIHWDVVVSEEGMIVEIPTSASDTIDFYETDKDGDITLAYTGGTVYKMDVNYDSDDKLYANHNTGITMVDETADDKTVGYDASVHATKAMYDSDTHSAELEFYVDEVTVDLQLVAGGEVSITSDALGDVLIKDTEASTNTATNLIVVGGSCINSAAATLLGGNYCGAAFTEATDVAADQFLIKGFENSAIGGKFALLVAGYEMADTVNAATYLTNKDVDTSKAYKGTSANSATLVVA